MVIARQSTARTVMVGPVLDADGVAVTDGVVGDFKISKNGGAPAALNGSATLTHRHTGHYSLALTASDLDTVGQAEVVIDDTVNACPIKTITVVEEAVYDAMFAASALGYVANAPVNVVQFGGSNGTFSSGRPEVNTTHAAGTAWGSGAITAGAIASNAITDAKIATGAITAEKIAADAITGDKIAPGAIAKGDQLTGLNDLSAADVNAEVDTALADYDPPTHTELTARTLASADYATASALTTVDTEIGVIDGIVDSLLARSVPLTVTTCVVVDDAANTASTFETNLAETDDDHWNGAFLLAASGDLAGQVRRVTDYDGTTKFITVDGGFTAEPAAAVSMVLVNR